MGFKESLVSALASFASAAPYHLLVYGTLIGTELYQVSFRGPQSEILADRRPW